MGEVSFPVAQFAKSSGKQTLALPLQGEKARGTLLIDVEYIDTSISEEELAQLKKEYGLAEEKLSKLYASYFAGDREHDNKISSIFDLTKTLKGADLFEETLAAFQGTTVFKIKVSFC